MLAAGVAREQVVLDPGLGFAKTAAHNWTLLAGLDRIEELGFPVLVGASRKSFLGRCSPTTGVPRPVDDREAAHAVLVAHLARCRRLGRPRARRARHLRRAARRATDWPGEADDD